MKILFFSSTGNNIYIAQRLGGEMLSIPQLIRRNIYHVRDDVVGVIFPNYYMTLPDIVSEYLKMVELEADYIFTLCSYGSVEEGAFRALKKCNMILEEKYEVNYSNTVLMVDNFLPAFDMKEEKSIKKDEDIDARISIIKEDVNSRKEKKLDIVLDEDIIQQDLVHKEHFSNMLKLEITDNECIECMVCVKVCPRANIRLESKPVIGDNCEQCLGCVHHCSQHVIRTNMEKSSERFINHHIQVSQIIDANNQH